ncbi:MAG: trigger factor [Verrucomicrobiota bacterium]|jgi:trigger factor|nr:trigger factor [Verrucomicrobiota bacterium]
MNVTFDNVGPSRRRLKVEFSAQEVRQEYDESLAVYAKQARIKGFRPGRAPVEMIRRQYDKDILSALRDHLLAKGYHQALKEYHFESVAEMDLQQSDVKADEPYSFSLTMDVAPEFELPIYKGISVEAKKVEVSDDAVTQALDRYLEGMGKYLDIEEDRPVQQNDMVAVDYTATVDGQPMAAFSEKAKSLGEGRDFWVIANQEYSFLPEFGPQLIGLKVGDSKEISITFNEKGPIEELRDKTAVFSTTVKKIRARQKPVMDEAFFKSMDVKDEAELREVFKGMLQREAERTEASRRRMELLDKLRNSVQMDVPESEVQDETNHMIYEMVNENVRRGVEEKEIRDNLPKITESAKTAAADRVKLRYLLRAIAKKENISVSDVDVSALLQAHAQQANMSVKDWLKHIKRKEVEMRNALRKDLQSDKTVAFLLENATLTGDGAEPPKTEEKKEKAE